MLIHEDSDARKWVERVEEFGGGPKRVPLKLKDWWITTLGMTLEEKGLLVEVLASLWESQKELPEDLNERARYLRVDPRVLKRLWTKKFERKLCELRTQRRPVDGLIRSKVWDKTEGICHWCGVTLTLQKHQPNTYHVDHLRPVTMGGLNSIENLVPSCQTCNCSRPKREVRHV
jgi:hypothetical protein